METFCALGQKTQGTKDRTNKAAHAKIEGSTSLQPNICTNSILNNEMLHHLSRRAASGLLGGYDERR